MEQMLAIMGAAHDTDSPVILQASRGARAFANDTDLRLAMTGAIRTVLIEQPGVFDPRADLKPAIAAMGRVCAARLTQFGAVGRASAIRALRLEEMAKIYA